MIIGIVVVENGAVNACQSTPEGCFEAPFIRSQNLFVIGEGARASGAVECTQQRCIVAAGLNTAVYTTVEHQVVRHVIGQLEFSGPVALGYIVTVLDPGSREALTRVTEAGVGVDDE